MIMKMLHIRHPKERYILIIETLNAFYARLLAYDLQSLLF